MLAVPDLASHTLAPWQPELAELKCGISVDAPRLILKGAPEKARQRGAGARRRVRGGVLPRSAHAGSRHRGG